jgi:3-methyladenine DNA glycosylase AlkC
MAEPLKNIYTKQFFNRFIDSIKKIEPQFDDQSFLNKIYDKDWESRELKQRMRHITRVLEAHLLGTYEENINVILNSIPQLIEDGFKPNNLEFMFYPDFIELYGLEYLEESNRAFEKITQFVSCEFAVRPFLLKYPIEMVDQMQIWSTHKHESVRRLASEGSRPRLPWAMALPFLKVDPSPIMPILETLKYDSSEYVRRSVANNLNDISKDHPLDVIMIAKKWINKTVETDKLIKHACRTLLKQGDSEVMRLFGFGAIDDIIIDGFKITTLKVSIGNALEFEFNLRNANSSNTLIRLEYGIYYQKANGTLSRKVFKISEKQYSGNSVSQIQRKQSFKIITTRKFHVGKHQVSLIINGIEQDKVDFELV